VRAEPFDKLSAHRCGGAQRKCALSLSKREAYLDKLGTPG
jgi:hypothetical protein